MYEDDLVLNNLTRLISHKKRNEMKRFYVKFFLHKLSQFEI